MKYTRVGIEMANFAVGTLVLFFASSCWLYLTWSHANRTTRWKPVSATVVANGVQETMDGQLAGWATTIAYEIDGARYEAVVDEYLIGNQVTVYVNPQDAREVVATVGARMQDLGRPIVVTVGCGLFAIVLVLIALSPRED